jgi:hypothetical protein
MRDNLTRRGLLKTAIAAAGAPASLPGSAAGKSLIEPFNYSGVRLLDGMLRRQCLRARDFFYGIPDDNFLVGFRARAGLPAPGSPLAGWYHGDVFNAFGQYLSGMARLSKALGDAALGDKARRLLMEWAKTIEPGGYFFYSRRPVTPHYIYDKMMCGLVDLYEYAEVPEALPLMQKITSWASANLDRSRKRPLQDGATYDGNGEWYTLGENLYRAYELTGDPEYRAFGDVWRYPAYWDMFTRAEPPGPFGFHAYSHVNTLSSAAMAYAVSGDTHCLKVIINAFDWLERTQMYATGGFGPDEKLVAPDGSLGASLERTLNSFETMCGSWACFKLGRYLMRFTGEARYGDWIEKLVYNGAGAALPMQPDGSNFYYSEYALGGGRKAYASVKWSCCSGTYSQAIADYHNIIYFKDRDSLYVNLYVPSEVTWKPGDNEIKIEQETRYPESETAVFTIRPSRPVEFALKFRVPRWATRFQATVNNSPVEINAPAGAWAALRRKWNPGDRVVIRIGMELLYSPIDAQHPTRVALTYGPVVLVRRHSHILKRGEAPQPHGIAREGGELQFRAAGRPEGLFVPFYKPGFAESYQMYFELL